MHHSLHHLHDHSRDPQDMRNMGGLKEKMPKTYLTMLIATLAISGVPLFSGFMSKDEVLAGAWAFSNISPGVVANFVWIAGYVVAGMTAFYMFRMIFLTFWGQPKEKDINSHIHENPTVMIAPLVVLAILSLWLPFGLNPINPGSGWFLSSWVSDPTLVVPAAAQPELPKMKVAPNEAAFQSALHHETHHVHTIAMIASLVIAGGGIAFAFLRFGRSNAPGQQISWDEPRGINAFLFNRWYQDNLYEKYFPVGLTMLLSKVMAWFDQNIIDGIVNGVAAVTVGLARFSGAFDTYVVDGIVNFLAGITQFFGLLFRQLQTGRVQTYVVYVVVGVVVLFFAFR
jgi:NADH-quinone oxidoreductase subunit L